MDRGLTIAFFGSSLVSAYWNGAATYYRGIIKTLHQMGHKVTFYEPEIYERQANRDIEDPLYAKVVVYPPLLQEVKKCLKEARHADIIIKASGVGAFDRELEEAVVENGNQQVIFWDVDAPVTLDRMINDKTDYFRSIVPKFDHILTYGGGDPVRDVYISLGAKACTPIYNAFDPDTHHPVQPVEKYKCDLAFLGNRLPDREKRVEQYFIAVAQQLPDKQFILGGSGWTNKQLPKNIRYIGHVPTAEHNAFNCSPLAILNISRDSMASYGFSPATRVFEAAGAGACIITDAWKGVDQFFLPDEDILVANGPEDIVEILQFLDRKTANGYGQAAHEKALDSHTYTHRGQQLEEIFQLKGSIA